MQYNDLFWRFFIDPLAHGVACVIVAYLLAPTQFVKVVYQETGESYTSVIKRYLQAQNFRIFFSGAHIYAFRQLIAAFAFGFSQWLFICLLRYCVLTNFTLLVVWQSFLAGVIETVITVYSETKEIAANKGAFMKRPGAVKDIFTPLLFRNIGVASAVILAYEITKGIDSIFISIIISALLGVVATILTMPFDLVATQNCGSAVRMTWLGRLKQNIVVEKKFRVIFNGLTIRILQIVPYTIVHSLVMLFLGQA